MTAYTFSASSQPSPFTGTPIEFYVEEDTLQLNSVLVGGLSTAVTAAALDVVVSDDGTEIQFSAYGRVIRLQLMDGTVADLQGIAGSAVSPGQIGGVGTLRFGDNNPTTDAGSEPTSPIFGGDNPDVMVGTSGANFFLGGYGDDEIHGLAGADALRGNDGNDIIFGGSGGDNIIGGQGSDTLNGNDGNDYIDETTDTGLAGGPAGNNSIFGGDGDDTLIGGAGHDTMSGGTGEDVLRGGEGNDLLVGVTGADVLEGGLGDDELRLGNSDGAADTVVYNVDGAEGSDTILHFERGIDKIQLNDAFGAPLTADALEALFDELVINSSGGTTVLALPNGTEITLSGVPTVDLSDFVVSDGGGNTVPYTPPTLTVGNVTVDEDAGTATFTVTLSAASGAAVSVDYATVAGSAIEGSDFEGDTGTLTFQPGEVSKEIEVSILDDLLSENAETFTVVLSGAVNAGIAAGTGIGAITDDDIAPTLLNAEGPISTSSMVATSLDTGTPIDVTGDFAGGDANLTVSVSGGNVSSFSFGPGASAVPAGGTTYILVNDGGDDIVIGTLDGLMMSTGTLSIDFGANATAERVELLLQNIMFTVGDKNPRSIDITLTDVNANVASTTDIAVNLDTEAAVITGLDSADDRLIEINNTPLVVDFESAGTTSVALNDAVVEGGTLTVAIEGSGADDSDTLGFTNTSGVFVNGQARAIGNQFVSIDNNGGTAGGEKIIGTYTGGTGGQPLVVTFFSGVSNTDIAELVRNITFDVADDSGLDGARRITFELESGDGRNVSDTVGVNMDVAGFIQALTDADSTGLPDVYDFTGAGDRIDVFGDANTYNNDTLPIGQLETGDNLNGGDGADRLFARLDGLNDAVVEATLTDVEIINLKAQTPGVDVTFSGLNVTLADTINVDQVLTMRTLSFTNLTNTGISRIDATGVAGAINVTSDQANDLTVIGGNENDALTFNVGSGDVTVSTQTGNDTITFNGNTLQSGDAIDGGLGADSLDVNGVVTGGPTIAPTIANVETVTFGLAAGAGSVTFDGSEISGDAGTTTISVDALAANQTMTVEGLTDTVGELTASGQAGNLDVTYGTATGNVSIVGGTGSDSFTVSDGTVSLNTGVAAGANVGNDIFTISGGTVTAFGGAGNDTLDISGGTVTAEGGNGANIYTVTGGDVDLTGGTGTDTFDMGSSLEGGRETPTALSGNFVGAAGSTTLTMTAVGHRLQTGDVVTFNTVPDFDTGGLTDELLERPQGYTVTRLGNDTFSITLATALTAAVTQSVGASSIIGTFDQIDGGAGGGDSLTASISGLVTGLTGQSGDLQIDNVETVNLATTGTASTIDATGITNDVATAINVSGVASLTIENFGADGEVVTLNAGDGATGLGSTMTAALNVETSADARAHAITGGQNDDDFTFAAAATIDAADSVEGGTGDDTLTGTLATGSIATLDISNVEDVTLNVTGSTVVGDASGITGLNDIALTLAGAGELIASDLSDSVTEIDASGMTGDVSLARQVTSSSALFSFNDNDETVTVNAVGHGLSDGDFVTFNGVTTGSGALDAALEGGVFQVSVTNGDEFTVEAVDPDVSGASVGIATVLGDQFTATTPNFGTNPFSFAAGSSIVTVAATAAHGFAVGDVIDFAEVDPTGDATLTDTILNNGTFRVTEVVDANTYRFDAGVDATAANPGAGGSASDVTSYSVGAGLGDDGVLYTAGSGDDFLLGGGGDDSFVFGASLNADDFVNGGAGADSLTATIDGLTADSGDLNIKGVENIDLTTTGATSTLDLSNVLTSGFSGESVNVTLSGTAGVSITNQQAGVDIDASGISGGGMTIAYDTQTVDNTFDVTGSGVEDIFDFNGVDFGTVVIRDFDAGSGLVDRIDLSFTNLTAISQIDVVSTTTFNGEAGVLLSDAEFNTDVNISNQIFLVGVTGGQLNADDFIFTI